MVDLSKDECTRYSDSILIPTIGIEGQRVLKTSSALVIGAGGLGSPVLMYLCASGVGRIGLIDGDVVRLSNLQRQIVHGTNQLGELKVDSAKERLCQLNPLVKLDIYPQALSDENAPQIVPEYDVIVGCSDTFESYRLINRCCVQFDKPYVFGAASRFEGQVGVFFAPEGACYQCAFPALKIEKSEPYPFKGIFSPLPGVIGSMQAGECLKLLLGIGEPLISKLLIFNALDGSLNDVLLKKDPHCPVCSL